MLTWQESRILLLDYRGAYSVSGDKLYVERIEIEAPLWNFPLYEQMEGVKETWLVYGPVIRSFLYWDWFEWGHHYIYPFIKPGEIWIEDNSYPEDRVGIFLKCSISRFLMRAYTLTYPEAQIIADAYGMDHVLGEIKSGKRTLKSFYPKKNNLVIEYEPPVRERLERGADKKNAELEEFRAAKESLTQKRSKLKDRGWTEIFIKLQEAEQDLMKLPT